MATSSTLPFAQAQRYGDLLRVLVQRNLKVRYRGSFLGIYWSLLNPLAMTGLYTAIFGQAFESYYSDAAFKPPLVNYMMAAFTGLVVINFFSGATTQALTSIVSNGALLNKIRLPVSIFPAASITANCFQFVVGSLPFLAFVTIISSKGGWNTLIDLLVLPLPLIALVLVATGVGLLVSSLYVFFRDLPYFYELVVFVLWISSPVFYPSAIVPPQLKPLLALNPLSSIIESVRQIALTRQSPNLILVADALLRGIVICAIGWVCFRTWRSRFMDLL